MHLTGQVFSLLDECAVALRRVLTGDAAFHPRSKRQEMKLLTALATELASLAPADTPTADLLVCERLLGLTLHILGNHANGLRHIDNMLRRYVAPADRSHRVRFHYDQKIAANCFKAEIRWGRGFSRPGPGAEYLGGRRCKRARGDQFLCADPGRVPYRAGPGPARTLC